LKIVAPVTKLSDHGVEGGKLGPLFGGVKSLRHAPPSRLAMFNSRAEAVADWIDDDVEAVGVEVLVALPRLPPLSGQPSSATTAAGLEGVLTGRSADKVFLHVTGADAADAQRPIVRMLHDMDVADILTFLNTLHSRPEITDKPPYQGSRVFHAERDAGQRMLYQRPRRLTHQGIPWREFSHAM
jgi:hypothetical protein